MYSANRLVHLRSYLDGSVKENLFHYRRKIFTTRHSRKLMDPGNHDGGSPIVLDRYGACAKVFLGLVIGLFFLFPTAAAAHTPHIDVAAIRFAYDFDGARLLFAIVRENLWMYRNGDGWRQIWRGLPFARCRDIEVVGGQPILATDAGLYFSMDRGNSWAPGTLRAGVWPSAHTLSLADAPAPELRLASGVNGEALCLYEGSVLRSQDFGVNWTVWEPGDAAVRAAAFVNGCWLLGMADGTVVAYDAEGAVADSWSIGLEVTAIAASAEREVFVGTDGQGVWRLPFGSAPEPLGPPETRITSLMVLPPRPTGAGSGLAASEWRDGVYVRQPGKSRWILGQRGLTREAQADHPSFRAPQFRQLLVEDGGDAEPMLLLGGFDGLFRSKDGGLSWQPVDTGVTTRIVVAATSASRSRLILSTYGDGAEFYDRSLDGRKPMRVLPRVRLFAAARVEHPGGNEEIWMSAHDQVHVFDPTGKQLRTAPLLDAHGQVSRGSALRGRLVPLAKRMLRVFPVHLRNVIRAAVVRRGGVAGLRIRFPAFGSQFAVPSDFAQTGLAYLGTWHGGLFVTDDGGRTFRSNGLSGVGTLHDLAVVPTRDGGHELLAATGQGLQLIKQEAACEEPMTAGGEPVLRTTAAPTGSGGAIAFASTWRALLRGERSGTGHWTWHHVLEGLDGHPVIEIGLSPNLATSGIVVINIAGCGLLRSTDAGRSFAPCRLRSPGQTHEKARAGQLPAFPDAARTITFARDFPTSGLAWAASGTSVLESCDGGETWAHVERGGTDGAS